MKYFISCLFRREEINFEIGAVAFINALLRELTIPKNKNTFNENVKIMRKNYTFSVSK